MLWREAGGERSWEDDGGENDDDDDHDDDDDNNDADHDDDNVLWRREKQHIDAIKKMSDNILTKDMFDDDDEKLSGVLPTVDCYCQQCHRLESGKVQLS